MKKFNTIALVAAAIATTISLSACGSVGAASDETALGASTPDVELSTPETLPIEVYPAVGTMNGVVADPTDPSGLICADGMDSILLDSFSGGVEYNGMTIMTDSSYLGDNDDDRSTGLYVDQYDVSLLFSGTPANVVSVIVESSDGYSFDDTWRDHADPDAAINVTSDMLMAGMTMVTSDFVFVLNNITSVTLCVAP